MAVLNEDPLAQRLGLLSSRLTLETREFAAHGTLASPVFRARAEQSTELVLFQKFVHLMHWLDGETLRRIGK